MRARERCARAAPREGVARAREGVAREPVRGRGRGDARRSVRVVGAADADDAATRARAHARRRAPRETSRTRARRTARGTTSRCLKCRRRCGETARRETNASSNTSSLEGLFGRALADAFHDSASFRTDVRRAMRRDLFAPDENLSAEANAAMSALSSSVHVNWFESRTGYAALSALFESRGIEGVTGERFIRTLGGLCGEPCHGTLIDIASPVGARRIRHSWHQDSGLDRLTVMLGFPASTPSESVGLPTGVGVFSHAVRLSHALRHPSAPGAGAVLRWEDVASDADVEIDARLVARPAFARDREIIVYRDSSHLHSAPDVAHREAVWRFM